MCANDNELLSQLKALTWGIVSGAVVYNSLKITGKKLDAIKVVIDDFSSDSGKEAAKIYFLIGILPDNIKIAKDLEDINIMTGSADIMLNTHPDIVVSSDLVQSMAENPIIMIIHDNCTAKDYITIKHARRDVVVYTKRWNPKNDTLISLVYLQLVKYNLIHGKIIDDNLKLKILYNLISSM